jgi:hypothetical protein
MAIRVRFIADIADWVRGLGRSNEALSDTEQGLEDVMEQAIKLGRQAGLTTDEIARDFSKAFGVPLDRAKSAVSEVIDETKKLDRAQDDAGRESGKLGDNLSELGSIARDVFSGDFAGAADSVLGSLGGIAAAAGVGGAVGGAVADAISGLVGKLVEAWDPFNSKTQQVKDDVASALASMGGAFDDAAIEQRLRDAATDTEKWNQAALLAQATGMSLADSLRAVAGVSKDESAAAFQALQDAMNDSNSAAQGLSRYGLRDLEQQLQGNASGFDDAATRSQALKDAINQTGDSATAAKDKTNEFAQSLANVPGGKEVMLKLNVDDSKLRSYVPPVIKVNTRLIPPTGREMF